jgi:hypothetical protein
VHISERTGNHHTIGIDVGMNTFHLVGLDKRGAIVLQQKVSRLQLGRRLNNIPRCLKPQVNWALCAVAIRPRRPSCVASFILRRSPVSLRPGDEAICEDQKSPRRVRGRTNKSRYRSACATQYRVGFGNLIIAGASNPRRKHLHIMRIERH